jgi:hypothetical protein
MPVAAKSAAVRWARLVQVGDFSGDVVGDAADGEVRVGVGDDHGDLGGGVELAGPQRRADAGIAAADGDDMTNGHAGFGS